MARPSANSGDYLRCYRSVRKSGGTEDEETLFVPQLAEDDRAIAAKLNFREWAEDHDWYIIKEDDRADEEDGRITPPIVAEFELAFVRYYKDQWRRLAIDQKRLTAQFDKVVDSLKELQRQAERAASLGDPFGEHAKKIATLLIDPPVPRSHTTGKIQARDASLDEARQLLGAFAHYREPPPPPKNKAWAYESPIGAPWTHERRCANALAKAWHRAFRSLPDDGQRELFHNLLCSVLPGNDPPDMDLTDRTLERLQKSSQFGKRARTPWHDSKE
jgi:hypothetical protein